MIYSRKKCLLRDLSKVFNDVSIADENGNIFYLQGKRIIKNKVKEQAEIENIKEQIRCNKNELKVLCQDDILSQGGARVVYIGKKPVLVRFNMSSDKIIAENKSKIMNTLKIVMEHDTRLYTDHLTGVYNRAFLTDFFEDKDISAVAMIDIDDFKIINDTYGHTVGDQVLQKVSNVISLCVKGHGKVIRFGGDEFVVVFEEIDKDDLVDILKQISRAVSSLRIQDLDIKTSASVGAVYGSGRVYDLISRADAAMYKLKRSKK